MIQKYGGQKGHSPPPTATTDTAVNCGGRWRRVTLLGHAPYRGNNSLNLQYNYYNNNNSNVDIGFCGRLESAIEAAARHKIDWLVCAPCTRTHL